MRWPHFHIFLLATGHWPLMFNLRPVGGEVKVRTVGLRVTLHAAGRRRHEAEAFGRRGGVRTARPVAGLALHVSELRRRDQRLEAAGVEADDVTADAFVVELLALAFERRHGVGVAGLLPDGVLLCMAGHAGRS